MTHHFETGIHVGKGAWHGRGKVLATPPRTVREALIEADMAWRVLERPLATTVPTTMLDEHGVSMVDRPLAVDSHKALVRDSDGSLLGIVTASYVPLQNADAFAPFEPLMADGSLAIETAGSLMAGRRVYMLGRFASDATVRARGGLDAVSPYLLIATGHDGGMAARAALTPIRVVCWNTLSAAVSRADAAESDSAESGYVVPHRGDVAARVAAAASALASARRELERQLATWDRWASAPMDERAVRELARRTFDSDFRRAEELIGKFRVRQEHETRAEIREETARKIAELEALLAAPTRTEDETVDAFLHGPGAELAGATAWGAWNAITYRVDHVSGGRSPDRAEARTAASWFGAGPSTRARAARLIAAAVGD